MLDLKTIFRARKYTRQIINSLGKTDDTFLIDDSIFQAAEIGRIYGKGGLNFGEGIVYTLKLIC